MFDKNKFAQILKSISETYDNQRDFSKKSEINRTYLSQYMNMKLDKPPKPEILEKLANSSRGMVSYQDLMSICGYINYPNFSEDTTFIYQQLVAEKINSQFSNLNIAFDNLIDLTTNKKILSQILNDFTKYCEDIVENAYNKNYNKKLADYTDVNSPIVFKGFKILYSALLRRLYSLRTNVKHDDIFLINRNLILTDDTDDTEEAISIVKSSKEYISILYQKWLASNQFYMCPVYGQISAGQPNWAEENIEGRLPIAPDLMDIINPEEYFFLRVNGESMNNVIKNGGFALIHKQDMVEDGEIAVVLVNGYDATLKRFTKKGDVVVLEPDSNDNSFKTQIYDKTTPIKILGKYVGKMEINK